MRTSVALIGFLGLAQGALAQDVTVIDPKAFFPEGPVMLEGTLYYAQYSGNVVSAWDGTTKTDIWTGEGCGLPPWFRWARISASPAMTMAS